MSLLSRRTIISAVLVSSSVYVQGALFNNSHRLQKLFERYDGEKQRLEEAAGALLICENKENNSAGPLYAQLHTRDSLIKACAYGRQKVHNETISNGIEKEVLRFTRLPAALSSLVTHYAQPGWSLSKTVKIHDGMVSRITPLHNAVASYSADAKNEEGRGKLWDMHTGDIIHTGIHQSAFALETPEYLVTRLRAVSLLDCDVFGHKGVAVDVNQGLITWNISLDLAAAERQGQVQRIVRKKPLAEQPVPFNTFCTVLFSPCGKYIIAGCLDGTITLLHASTHEELYTLNHQAGVTALYMVNDEKTETSTLLAGLRTGEVAIWHRDYEFPLAGDMRKLSQARRVLTPLLVDHKQSLSINLDRPQALFMTEFVPPVSAVDVFKAQCQQCAILCCDCTQLWKKDCVTTCCIAYQCLKNCAVCCSNLPRCCIECGTCLNR